MKKNLLYLSILVILSGLTYYFVFTDHGNEFSSKEANFTIKDTANISTVFLSSMKGENIKLDRTENGWRLNDSMIPRIDAINLLLATLYEQKVSNPVSLNIHDEAIKELSTNSTKVEIYIKGKKTTVFYVAKNQAANNLTYMLMEGAKRPFIIKLPLQNTFVGIRYMTGLAEWRTNQLFFSSNPVEKIEVVYKDSVQHNFTVYNNDSITLESANKPTNSLNSKRLKAYVGFYENLYCYGFETSYMFKDSIINNGRQLGTISLKRKNGKTETLCIYFKPKSQDTKSVITIDNTAYDFNVFYGLLNKQDFLSIDKESVEKMFRTNKEFYEMDTK